MRKVKTMSEADIKKFLKESSKVGLIAWKVELKQQIKEATDLISRIDKEVK